jgi:hypothetical protein
LAWADCQAAAVTPWLGNIMAAEKARLEREAKLAIELAIKKQMGAENAERKKDGLPPFQIHEYKKVLVKREEEEAQKAAVAAAAEAARLAAIAAAKAKAPVISTFTIPYRRTDVFTELTIYKDPLDFPSSSWVHHARHSGAALSGGVAQQVSPGLIRRLERRGLFSRTLSLTLELIEIKPPESVRWRILRRVGCLALPSIVGEEYDGEIATTQLVVQLENAAFGTRVSVHLGAHGMLELPSGCPEWVGPLVETAFSWILSALSRPEWDEQMRRRGYEPLEAKLVVPELGVGSACASSSSSVGWQVRRDDPRVDTDSAFRPPDLRPWMPAAHGLEKRVASPVGERTAASPGEEVPVQPTLASHKIEVSKPKKVKAVWPPPQPGPYEEPPEPKHVAPTRFYKAAPAESGSGGGSPTNDNDRGFWGSLE